VAIFVEVLSDNKNRTVSELRHIFTKNGGRIGESGSVAWMFKRKGYFVIDKSKASEDNLMDIALSSGAEDLRTTAATGDLYSTEKFDAVSKP